MRPKLIQSIRQWNLDFTYISESLVATYCNDLCDSFTTQLLSLRALFKDDIKHIPTVMELTHFLVVKNYSLLPTFQDLYTVFLLFLTLPVTVATAERSFSKSAVFKLGSADQRGSATGSHGVRERIPKSSNCLHGFKRWSKCTMKKIGGGGFCRNLGGGA